VVGVRVNGGGTCCMCLLGVRRKYRVGTVSLLNSSIDVCVRQVVSFFCQFLKQLFVNSSLFDGYWQDSRSGPR
jgi:hypothetical protein